MMKELVSGGAKLYPNVSKFNSPLGLCVVHSLQFPSPKERSKRKVDASPIPSLVCTESSGSGTFFSLCHLHPPSLPLPLQWDAGRGRIILLGY